MSLTNVNDGSFETDVIKSTMPVLVDYWAEWCGPCLSIAPVLAEIASEMEGKVDVAKINIDENPISPTKYGVRGIPTLMLFKDGQITATKVGVGGMPKSKLIEWIESSLDDSEAAGS